MKTLFIEARKKIKLQEKTKNKLAKLLSPIYIYYTIQYKDYASQVKEFLQDKGKQIKGFKQILGCSALKPGTKEPILYIGSGLFHIYNIGKQTSEKVPIYILDSGKLRKLDKKELDKIDNKKKASLSRFYSADKLGILVSCKPGQLQMNKAIRVKDRFEKKDKKAYLFLADNININELENYDIDCWLNTACPGLSLDSAKIYLTLNYTFK